jgi:Cu-Zn family superoxide dismutase
MINSSYIVSVFIAGAMALSGSAVHAKEQTVNPSPVKISMINKDGHSAGYATLKETPLGVGVHLHVTGLKPGVHGIHFHETGVCTPPDFKSTGGHINPEHKEHGFLNPNGPHAGDLKNVTANNKGEINTVFSTQRVTLKKGMKNSLIDQDGSALVIHEGPDDQKSNPAGNSGGRVLCGVIK